MVAKDVVEATVAAYVAATEAFDPDRYADVFAPDAVRHSPGEPPLAGREAIRQRATRTFGAFSACAVSVERTFVAGASVAYVYTAVLTAKDGRTARIGGVDVFEVDEAGKIAVARFYHDGDEYRALLGR